MKARQMTPKDFVPHLLVALADLTELKAGVSVPHKQTYGPVCTRMKINADDFGDSTHGKEGNKTPWVHRQIDLAFRQMRDKGLGEYSGRGLWALTEEGVEQLAQAKSFAAPSASDLAAAKAQAAVEDSDDNLVHLSVAENEHPYSDDPYIRGLAVEQTACFGAYSGRSDVCTACLITEDCKAAVAVRKAEIAAELEREEIAARKAAEAKAKKKDQQDASIDELKAAMSDTTTAKFGKKGRYQPGPNDVVSDAFAQREAVCTQCSEKVSEDAPCFWVEGEGIFHPECINAPDGA